MLIRLAFQNIKEKKFRNLLAILSIIIGTASLIIFLGINNGIKTATFTELEKATPLTQITVRPNTENTGVLSFLGTASNLDNSTVEKISQIPGVTAVYPETQFNSFASIEAKLLGFTLVTDTMIFGLPQEFLHTDFSQTNPVPAIIPRRLLDIYNFTIAAPQGLPSLSEENLIGKDLLLYPNHSNFFPSLSEKEDPIKLEVVGFSDKVNLVGITLSQKFVAQLNKKYAKDTTKYIELFVETDSASQTTQIAEQIEALGYQTAYFQKNVQGLDSKFAYLTASLSIISGIILLTAIIAIMSTFLATIAERTKELGLLRALGASKKQIRHLILMEAGIVGAVGSTIGILLGLLSSNILDHLALNQLSTATFTPDTLVKINFNLIAFTFALGLLLTILTAYFPAQKASRLDPISALA